MGKQLITNIQLFDGETDGLYPAGCFGDKLGLVAAGYFADLLLIDGNPLVDVSILRDPDNLLMIMKDGQLYKPLQARRAEERQAAA